MYGGAAILKISLVLELVDNLLHAFFGTSTFMFGGWLLSLCMNNGSFNGLRYGACNPHNVLSIYWAYIQNYAESANCLHNRSGGAWCTRVQICAPNI